MRQDVEQRLSVLNQEAPKVNLQAQAAAANAASRGSGRGRGGGQRKKRKTEEADYADGASAASPRAASGSGTSDRSVGNARGRGRGRGGGRKRKKKRDGAGEDEDDGEEEEEAPAQEEDVETMDSTTFWAMIDQQYCDPSKSDIEMLKNIRTTGTCCCFRSSVRPAHAQDTDHLISCYWAQVAQPRHLTRPGLCPNSATTTWNSGDRMLRLRW